MPGARIITTKLRRSFNTLPAGSNRRRRKEPRRTSIQVRCSNVFMPSMRGSAGLERIPASSIRRRDPGCFLAASCRISNSKPIRPVPDRCGTCTRCIDACPTQAIVEPYVLDSRKCIAYTTIELRGEIPEQDRAGIGHHLFGCDICQDVCPWNSKSPHSTNAAFNARPGLFWPDIDRLLDLTEPEWQQMVRGTSMKRAKIKGLLRNLMVVAGNSGVREFLPKLRRFFSTMTSTSARTRGGLRRDYLRRRRKARTGQRILSCAARS